MSAHAYTEDQLFEQPAVGLFADLGWQTVSAIEETFDENGTLGREVKGEVLVAWRRDALVRLNPGRYAGVAACERVSDEDFNAQFETLNEEVETLYAQVPELEQTIAAKVAEIFST
jgi:type I restriction enzyme R subunit